MHDILSCLSITLKAEEASLCQIRHVHNRKAGQIDCMMNEVSSSPSNSSTRNRACNAHSHNIDLQLQDLCYNNRSSGSKKSNGRDLNAVRHKIVPLVGSHQAHEHARQQGLCFQPVSNAKHCRCQRHYHKSFAPAQPTGFIIQAWSRGWSREAALLPARQQCQNLSMPVPTPQKLCTCVAC